MKFVFFFIRFHEFKAHTESWRTHPILVFAHESLLLQEWFCELRYYKLFILFLGETEGQKILRTDNQYLPCKQLSNNKSNWQSLHTKVIDTIIDFKKIHGESQFYFNWLYNSITISIKHIFFFCWEIKRKGIKIYAF